MKFNISSPLVFIALLAIALVACTDPIDIELDEGTPQLNVDAFLNDKPEEQKVRLVMTTNYFDNESVNSISDATVTLTSDLQEEWTFSYDKDGYYVLPYTPGDTLIRPFVNYTLWIKHNGATFTASALSMPTTVVDSIGGRAGLQQELHHLPMTTFGSLLALVEGKPSASTAWLRYNKQLPVPASAACRH